MTKFNVAELTNIPQLKYENHKTCKIAFLTFSNSFSTVSASEIDVELKTMITREKKKQKRLKRAAEVGKMGKMRKIHHWMKTTGVFQQRDLVCCARFLKHIVWFFHRSSVFRFEIKSHKALWLMLLTKKKEIKKDFLELLLERGIHVPQSKIIGFH